MTCRRLLLAVLLVAPCFGLAEPVPVPSATSQPTTRPDMSPILSEGTSVLEDVSYVHDPAEKQKLDIYFPKDAQAHSTGLPIVLFVHGGEWAKGDKREVSYKPKFFNEHGVIFVSINYRLSATDKHPAQVNDVASAVRWVRDNARSFGGDPGKVVLMGHSAGCHLVTLATTDPRYLAGVGLRPTDLAGTVAWSGGAYDLWEKLHAGGLYPDYIRQNFGDTERPLRAASPISHIGDAPTPPILFASAENGNTASRAIAEQFAGQLKEAGATAGTLLLKDRTHVLANHLCGAPGDTTGPALLQFIQQVTATAHKGGGAK